MAEPNKQTVQDLYDQAISQGIPEAEVINHLSQFETPEHKSFLAQYHTNKAKEFGSVQKEPDMIDELVGAAKEHPGVAATAAVLPVAYYGAKAGIDYLTDIAKQKALNALEPSEAIKIQRDQLIDKEKQRAFEQAKNKETLEHQAELRRIELAKQNEQLTREQLRTQQLQSKAGVAPTAPATNVAPPTSTAPVTLPNAQATTPVATTSTPEEMANFATSGVTPNAQPAPVSPAQQVLKAETNLQPTVNPASPIATTEPNPVVSGEGTSPLHNPEGQGLTQVEATSASATPNAAFPAETNTTKESGNLTNPAENPTQGGVEQIKKEVAPEKEFKSSTRIRMSKDDEERIKAIKEAGIAPTHQLTREEIANQQMHPEMKKIVEEGNVKIESNPELKSEIEKLKAGHKIPNGFVWIPDMGSGDIHFINTHGFEKYRQFKKEEMGGKPIGEYALNPKDKNYNPDLREKIKKWSERNYPTSNIAGVSEMTGEQKGKAAPEETNFFSKMGKLKPVAKTIAGVGGVMMALTELAQAREEAKHGNPNSAIGRVAKVATGFAPLATYTNETNSNEQEAMNKIRSQQKPIKGAVVPK